LVPLQIGADMEAPMPIHLTVNGEPRTALVHDVDDMLIDYLRDELDLVDVKIGCREGACGACAVLVNGEATTSCLVYLARSADLDVRTAAHLVEEPLGERIGAAFVRHRSMQCGYCTPGLVVCAYGYLSDRAPEAEPDRAELADACRGHLCRCTGYTRILDAMTELAQRGNEVADGPD
jgi:carbon-monoxide dehydrogenase small subunit